jgi:hypothetical protein
MIFVYASIVKIKTSIVTIKTSIVTIKTGGICAILGRGKHKQKSSLLTLYPNQSSMR